MRKPVLLLLLCASACAGQGIEEPPRWTRDKPFVALTTATFGSAIVDVETTQALNRKYDCLGCWREEYNPLARPFVKNRNTQYAVWNVTAGGASWLGWKMKRSDKKWVRRLWWTPQVAVLGANIWGITTNVRSLSKR